MGAWSLGKWWRGRGRGRGRSVPAAALSVSVAGTDGVATRLHGNGLVAGGAWGGVWMREGVRERGAE